MPTELHNNDRKVLAEHFRGKSFNDKLVADFCTRNKIAIVDAGSVEDFIYQVEYDERMLVVYPLVLAEIAKIQFNADYISDAELKKISDFNDQISVNIAKILEDNGVLYREITFLESLAGDVAKIMATAQRRVSNMSATVLAEMAQEKLGDPLTIKALANERAQIADRKAKKESAETPAEEATAKADCPDCKDLPEGQVAKGHDHRVASQETPVPQV